MLLLANTNAEMGSLFSLAAVQPLKTAHISKKSSLKKKKRQTTNPFLEFDFFVVVL
jgi:hypothetical protein